MSAHPLPYPESSAWVSPASCRSDSLAPPLPHSACRSHSPASSGSLYRPCAGFSVRCFSHAHTKLTGDSVYKTNKWASRLKATAGHARLWLSAPSRPLSSSYSASLPSVSFTCPALPGKLLLTLQDLAWVPPPHQSCPRTQFPQKM